MNGNNKYKWWIYEGVTSAPYGFWPSATHQQHQHAEHNLQSQKGKTLWHLLTVKSIKTPLSNATDPPRQQRSVTQFSRVKVQRPLCRKARITTDLNFAITKQTAAVFFSRVVIWPLISERRETPFRDPMLIRQTKRMGGLVYFCTAVSS